MYYVMFEMFYNKLASSCEDTHIKSPRIGVSGIVRRYSIEDGYPLLQELAGGM